MVSSWQCARGTRRYIGALITAAVVALPASAAAQTSGDGFLFKRPAGSFVIRGGYGLANTDGQPFTVLKAQTTIGSRSFDAVHLGLDANFAVSRRFDFTLTLEGSSRTTTAEYREWEEDGQPITNQSTLDRGIFGAGFRYYLTDRGRQISALAFIPARTLPYIGATGGVLWYEFMQKGDFVEVIDENTGNIYTDEIKSDNAAMMGQVFAGIERRLSTRWSLSGETRYTHSSAKLTDNYAGLGNIPLSGLAFTLGAVVRF
jgi:hypothetical protein